MPETIWTQLLDKQVTPVRGMFVTSLGNVRGVITEVTGPDSVLVVWPYLDAPVSSESLSSLNLTGAYSVEGGLKILREIGR